MNNDEMLAQLRAVRSATAQVVDAVDAAIARLEALQPVVDAYHRRRDATREYWQDMMQAGTPDNLSIEQQLRHASDMRRADLQLMRALGDYLGEPASEQQQGQQGQQGQQEQPQEAAPETDAGTSEQITPGYAQHRDQDDASGGEQQEGQQSYGYHQEG